MRHQLFLFGHFVPFNPSSTSRRIASAALRELSFDAGQAKLVLNLGEAAAVGVGRRSGNNDIPVSCNASPEKTAIAIWSCRPLLSCSWRRCCGTSKTGTTSAGTVSSRARHEAPAPIGKEVRSDPPASVQAFGGRTLHSPERQVNYSSARLRDLQ